MVIGKGPSVLLKKDTGEFNSHVLRSHILLPTKKYFFLHSVELLKVIIRNVNAVATDAVMVHGYRLCTFSTDMYCQIQL